MKRDRLAAAALTLAALIALRLLLPDLAAGVRRAALDALRGDTDYREAFEQLSDRLSAVPAPAQIRAAERYAVEEAVVTLGEHAPPEPELPETVAAFLERQEPYSAYSLPENVDYSYLELPFGYAVPVAGYESSGFGFRMHPILEEVKFHFGTDIAAFSGEDILAFADGTVTFAGPSDSYGNYITVDHGDGWTSLYAHCSYLYVQAGQRVSAGEKIALVGATGHVTGPHLHFELKHDGVYYNPEYYING